MTEMEIFSIETKTKTHIRYNLVQKDVILLHNNDIGSF